MNSKRRSDKAVSTTMRDRLAEWRQLLEGCGKKPTRKRVHALRVVTLRLQAEFEHDLEGLPHASHQAQAILRFGRQAEKLRRALGPVRELDVWIGKLRDLRASHGKSADYVPQSTQECVRGIERLEDRLQRNRKSAEKKLVTEIEKRGDRLVKASEEIEGALAEYRFGEEQEIAEELVARFRVVRAQFPTIDEGNLHDFRKSIKTVRYLAEIRAPGDPACRQIAMQMKKVQSAIGEWHDWQALAEVDHGHSAKSKAVGELLETLMREAFETAVSTVNSITVRVLGEGGDRVEPSDLEERKPPARSDHGAHAELETRLA